MARHVFRCGPDADLTAFPSQGRELRLAGASANVDLRFEHIRSRFAATEPDLLTDFLEIASYVYAADNCISRGGVKLRNMGADWRRSFLSVIAVRRPDIWSSPAMLGAVQQVLEFLSNDQWDFEFVQLNEAPHLQEYFSFSPSSDHAVSKGDVVLFSGGLDSLAGASQALRSSAERMVLVSHRSSTTFGSRQVELANELIKLFDHRIVHVPVRVGMKKSLKAVEHTQRTRSFLFSAIAAVVSSLEGSQRIRFFENGIMSVNLPISPQVVGTRASRTTHPRSLMLLQKLVRLVQESSIVIDNPFIWMTKAEVICVLKDKPEAGLMRRAISCSRTREITVQHPHCGTCAQCLHRRIGVLGAAMEDHDPEEAYEVKMLLDPRADGEDRLMAVDIVRSALEFTRLADEGFLTRFGGELSWLSAAFAPNDLADRLRRYCELFRRHGNTVRNVFVEAVKQNAKALVEGSLHPSCLLRITVNPGIELDHGALDACMSDYSDPAKADYEVDYSRSSEVHLALDEKSKRVLISGIQPISGSTAYRLLHHLVKRYKTDRDEGKIPANFQTISSEDLSGLLGLPGPEAVRTTIYRLREAISADFEKFIGLTLSRDAVVENVSRCGYRLNPRVRLVALQEIERPQCVT